VTQTQREANLQQRRSWKWLHHPTTCWSYASERYRLGRSFRPLRDEPGQLSRLSISSSAPCALTTLWEGASKPRGRRQSPGSSKLVEVSDTVSQSRDDSVAWGITAGGKPRWPALMSVLVAIALQLVLPPRLIQGLGYRWLIPALEGGLLVILLIANPGEISEQSKLRQLGIALIALITVANAVSLTELIHALLYSSIRAGRPLVYASVPVWLTNIIVFGLWYWELDRGGPAARRLPHHRQPDFLFPQMSTPGAAPGWSPSFFDYLYTAFTNATTFSSTDSVPLTGWAKLLMALQSLASLVTVVVVVSRAVNILS